MKKRMYSEYDIEQFKEYEQNLNDFLKYKYNIDSFTDVLKKIEELKKLIKKIEEQAKPQPQPELKKIKAPMYITRADLYKIVGCTKGNLTHWEKAGLLKPRKVGGKYVYSFKRTIEDLLASNKIKYHSNILKNTSHYIF